MNYRILISISLLLTCSPKSKPKPSETKVQTDETTMKPGEYEEDYLERIKPSKEDFVKRLKANQSKFPQAIVRRTSTKKCHKTFQAQPTTSIKDGSKVRIISAYTHLNFTVLYQGSFYCFMAMNLEIPDKITFFEGRTEESEVNTDFYIFGKDHFIDSHFDQPYSYGFEVLFPGQAGNYIMNKNQLLVCNITDFSSKKPKEQKECRVELIRPENGVWQSNYISSMKYSIYEYKNRKLRKLKNGAGLYSSYTFERYVKRVKQDKSQFMSVRLFRDSLSKCTGIFGRKQDRAVLEASSEKAKVGQLISLDVEYSMSQKRHFFTYYFLYHNKIYCIDLWQISFSKPLTMIASFDRREDYQWKDYPKEGYPSFPIEEILLYNENKFIYYNGFTPPDSVSDSYFPYSYGTYEFKENRLILCPKKEWMKDNMYQNLKCYTKLIKKENQWESSYNPHWVYKKYFLSDNGEVKKDAGF